MQIKFNLLLSDVADNLFIIFLFSIYIDKLIKLNAKIIVSIFLVPSFTCDKNILQIKI